MISLQKIFKKIHYFIVINSDIEVNISLCIDIIKKIFSRFYEIESVFII
jgi:hypothetical protein